MAIDKAKSLKVADKHIAKQNYNKALNELLKVLKVAPDDVNLLNKVGDLYSKLGKTMHAIEHFLKVGDSYQKSGFALKAVALYKKILRLDPKYMDARQRLVDLYSQQGYHSETKGELRIMAEHYYKENLFPRALECYERMVDIDPANLDARIKISEILVREGKRDSACEHFVAMARDLLEKTMINEAKKILSQGLKILPTHQGLLLLNCHTQLAEGKVEEALKQLKEVVESDPNNMEALELLAQTYMKRSQFEDARDLYLKLYERDASDPTPLEQLAATFINNNRLDDAFACIHPIAEQFLNEGNFEEATRLSRTILYANEDHLGAQELLVKIYIAANQKPNALLALEKVIHAYLDHNDLPRAEHYIAQLLEIDPTNQEWRDKLATLGQPAAAPSLPESDEIHVFDDQSLNSATLDESSIEMELTGSATVDENADDATRVANHLTEAQVMLKYNMVDKALEHLEKAKDIDFLHVGVNTNLKNLYLKQGEVNKAIPCMVSLVNASLEDQDYDRAFHIIDELEAYNSEIAGIHRSRVESMSGISSTPPAAAAPAPADDFALDFGDGAATDSLVFNDHANEDDVVDFSAMTPGSAGLDSTGLDGSAWSLDMDGDVLGAGGNAQDFNDLYNPAQVSDKLSGAHDLPSLAELGDDSRLDLSIPEELMDKQEEPVSGALGLDADSQIDLDASIGGTVPEKDAPLPELDQEVGAPVAAPEERAHAPLGGAQGSLASELEEIDFFISVEAYEDARNLIEDARRNFGEHPLLMEREHELAAKTQDMAQAKAAMSDDSGSSEKKEKEEPPPTGFFDLAAELNEEFFGEDIEEEEAHEVNDATSQEEIQSVEELFEEFKKGVDEQIDDEDHETHYDLGIAYKEMGLLDEAISEFKRASRDTSKFLECATMIGNCLIELGRMDEAVSHYEAHLASPGIDEGNDLALRYELALAFQRYGELEKALEYLVEIQGRQPDYRDVNGLIADLQ